MTGGLKHFVGWRFAFAASLVVALVGCSKPSDDAGAGAPKDPKEAASQLQQAFVSASVEVKHNAEAASQALRAADYEKAIQALHAVKASQTLTFEQGMAVHNSTVALEARLITAMEAGDANARRAYEQLKRLKRD